ncbi:acyltransferase [Paenibacillus sp. MMS20-IR301]|uniref:acyltransferase family protein n=1 Tax=Paenibacillus sp. MMS20-IR301 TaxID=2895946 RepID=UPI0028E3F3D9|nr:acyltransferase [Paenibacillus sp. MMS20-IR301]WNS43512.1 acyltransferase [Paenibacillus sp. MMS20-IR301]
MVNDQKKIQFIQMLRGLAAVAVTIFHAKGHLPEQSPFTQWFFSAASSGVDIFFILSGFIMVITTTKNDSSFIYFFKFLIKRFARLWPTYAILTIIYLPAMALSAAIINRVDVNPSVTDMVKTLLFVPLITSKADAPFWGGSVLHTGWTLNYEVYFYVFFALCLLFGRFRWAVFFGWVATTLLIIPSFTGAISFDSKHYYGFQGYINLMSSPLIWEFVAGVIIGLLYLSPFKIRNKQICWLLVMLTTSFTAWMLLGGFRPGYGILNWGFSYIFLFSTLAITSKTLEFKIPPVLVWLGNISYSLYLVHPIIVHPIANIAWEYEPLQVALQGMPYILFLTALSIVFAAISYEFLEKRLSNWLRERLFSVLNGINSSKKEETIRTYHS